MTSAVLVGVLHPSPVFILAWRLREFLAGVIPFVVGWPLGWLILRREESMTKAERILLALGLGQGILFGFTFLLLTLHLFYSELIPVLVGLSILLTRRIWVDLLRTILAPNTERHAEWRENRLWISFLVLAGIFGLGCSLLPALNYDALEYHLAVPEAWIRHHGWVAFPYNIYAWFPMNVEILYTWALALGETASATVVHFLFAVACAAGIFCIGARKGGESVGWLAAILFASSGLIVRLAVQADIDLGVCFYALLALMMFLRWTESARTSAIILSSVFVGLSLGCKYIAIISVWIPMLVLVLGFGPSGKRLRGFLWMAFLPLCLLTPWLVRNACMVGNPVFPLMYSWFGGANWTDAAAAFFRAAHSPKALGLSGHLIELIRAPLDLTILDLGVFSPLMLAGAALLLIRRNGSRDLRILWVYTLVTFVLWFVLTQRNHRFLVTVAPPLALIAAWGIAFGVRIQRTLRWAVFFVASYSLYLLLLTISLDGGLKYLVEGETEDPYYERLLPHTRAIHFLNETAEQRPVRAMFLGEAQSYGLRCEAIVPVVFNLHPWIPHDEFGNAVPQTPEQALNRLWELGVTHILFNQSEMNRLMRGFLPMGWPDGRELARLIPLMEKDCLKPVFETENGIIRVLAVPSPPADEKTDAHS
ncbi:MAG TPA: hypothetical protein PK395_04740 [bacterium]|nr:hypothetical protein [bacterium]